MGHNPVNPLLGCHLFYIGQAKSGGPPEKNLKDPGERTICNKEFYAKHQSKKSCTHPNRATLYLLYTSLCMES